MCNYIVYMHRCKINGKIYIGVTDDLNRRWRANGIEYKPHSGNVSGRPFWNAIQKHGWSNFEHIVLEENLTREKAQEAEKKYIRLYHSRDRNKGYNVAEGGNGGRIWLDHPKGMKGKKHSEEKKQAQRELMRKLNAEGKCGAVWKNGHPKGMKGKHQSEDYKERLRNIPPGEHPSARKVCVELPDGTRKQYDCLKYLSEATGVNNSTLIKIIKTKEPYHVKPQTYTNRENLLKLDGAKIYYLDNTEVTD